MAAKHFMIYYHKGTGTYVVTEPRPWARENMHYFQTHNAAQRIPTTKEIEKWLENNMNFSRVVKNKDIVLIQNIDPNINI